MIFRRKEKKHTLHIRNINHKTYVLLWNMRRAYRAGSWKNLIEKICEKFREEAEKKWA